MAIKGSATIELTNADGSNEIIKHDNMITNAVNDLCRSYRGEIAPIHKIASAGTEYVRGLFGGILLFNDTLSDDAGEYFLPSVNITGYSSLEAYNGYDVARGSYNVTESGLQEDGSYKLVWDFTTSQANGIIKSIALCPAMMGIIGATATRKLEERKDCSMKIGVTSPYNDSYGGRMLDDGTIDGTSTHNIRAVAVIGDVIYALDDYNYRLVNDYSDRFILNNGGKLRLYKFKVSNKNISLKDRVGKATYLGYDEVQLPSDFTSTLYTYASEYVIKTSFDSKTNKLCVFPYRLKSDVAPNGTIKYLDVDIQNGYSVTQHTFTNNTGGTIQSEVKIVNGGGCYFNFYVMADYILVAALKDGQKRLYTVKRSDNTDIKEIKVVNNNDFVMYRSDIGVQPVFWHNNILVFMFEYASDYTYLFYIVDMETGKLLNTNANKMSIYDNIDIGEQALFASTGEYLAFAPTVNPFVLTTKNNLDSPVTKTANQTMKITYTLSESAGV